MVGGSTIARDPISGFVAAWRRNAAGRHVPQAGLLTQAADSRGMEDIGFRHHGRRGRIFLSWFPRKYRLAIQMPDGKVERDVQLRKDGPPAIIVRLPASRTK